MFTRAVLPHPFSPGVTVLLTTQYLEEADHLAAEIAVVDHGTVIATGTPRELKARTGAQILAVRPAHPVDLPAVISIVTGFTLAAPEVSNTMVTARCPIRRCCPPWCGGSTTPAC